jgi:hypothetical protein
MWGWCPSRQSARGVAVAEDAGVEAVVDAVVDAGRVALRQVRRKFVADLCGKVHVGRPGLRPTHVTQAKVEAGDGHHHRLFRAGISQVKAPVLHLRLLHLHAPRRGGLSRGSGGACGCGCFARRRHQACGQPMIEGTIGRWNRARRWLAVSALALGPGPRCGRSNPPSLVAR